MVTESTAVVEVASSVVSGWASWSRLRLDRVCSRIMSGWRVGGEMDSDQ